MATRNSLRPLQTCENLWMYDTSAQRVTYARPSLPFGYMLCGLATLCSCQPHDAGAGAGTGAGAGAGVSDMIARTVEAMEPASY